MCIVRMQMFVSCTICVENCIWILMLTLLTVEFVVNQCSLGQIGGQPQVKGLTCACGHQINLNHLKTESSRSSKLFKNFTDFSSNFMQQIYSWIVVNQIKICQINEKLCKGLNLSVSQAECFFCFKWKELF